MLGLLEGKCAVITGAGRGHGTPAERTDAGGYRPGRGFFASEDARNITGQTLNIDGGMVPG